MMVKSTFSALIWAALGWIFLAVRNRHLESKLRRTFGNHGLTYGVEGIGITLHNPTAYEIIVREVVAKTNDPSCVLNYSGPKGELSERRFVTLPPFAGEKWLIPRDFYSFVKADFTSITVEFLYPSLFGSLRLLHVEGDPPLIATLNAFRKRDEVEGARLAHHRKLPNGPLEMRRGE